MTRIRLPHILQLIAIMASVLSVSGCGAGHSEVSTTTDSGRYIKASVSGAAFISTNGSEVRLVFEPGEMAIDDTQISIDGRLITAVPKETRMLEIKYSSEGTLIIIADGEEVVKRPI